MIEVARCFVDLSKGSLRLAQICSTRVKLFNHLRFLLFAINYCLISVTVYLLVSFCCEDSDMMQ